MVKGTAAPVARRPRIGAGRIRSDTETRAIEMEDGAAARCDRMDRHHRRADAYASDLRIEGALKRAGIEGHVGRCASHIEANDISEAGCRRRARNADNATGRPGQHGILTLKTSGVYQAAIRLNEVELYLAKFGGHTIDISGEGQARDKHRRRSYRHAG